MFFGRHNFVQIGRPALEQPRAEAGLYALKQ